MMSGLDVSQPKMARKGEDAGQHDGNHDGFLHDVFSHKEGCVRFLLAYQMPDTDGAALCHGDAEQISEHDDVDTIGTGGERFHSQHVDEVLATSCTTIVRRQRAGLPSSGSLVLSTEKGGSMPVGNGGCACGTV